MPGPTFVATPLPWAATLSAANPNRDGTGTLVNVVPGGSGLGSRVDTIRLIATGAVTAGVIRLFLQDGSANKYLFKEVLVPATVPSTIIETWTRDLTYADGLPIPNGWTLRAATHNAETFNVIARGGNFT